MLLHHPGTAEPRNFPMIKDQYLRYFRAERADISDDGKSDDSVNPEEIYDWGAQPCLSPEPKQTSKISLHDYYYPETFHYCLHAINRKLVPVVNPRVNSFIPPGVSLEPSVFQPALPISNASEVFLSIKNPSKAVRPSPRKVIVQNNRNAEIKCFFKPYDISKTNKAAREVGNYRKIAVANLAPNVRICRTEGIVKDDEDRFMGLLLTYIDCNCLTLACAAEPDTPESFRQKWVDQVKKTVTQLHDTGLVLGDARPENVLISKVDDDDDEQENGDAWLIDFGGGYTQGFVDKEKAGTVEGDLQGLENIIKYVLEGEEAW